MYIKLFSQLKQTVTLTQQKLFYSAVFTLLFFVIQFLPYLFRAIEGNQASTQGYLGLLTSEVLSKELSRLSQLPYSDVLTIVALYCITGLAVVALFTGLRNTILLTHNEIAERFGGTKTKLSYLIFARKITRYALFLCFLCLSILYLVPYWTNLMSIFVYSGMSISNIGYFFAGFLGMTINIYIIWVIIQFIWFHQKSQKTL